jgi:hypothetical protein
MTLIETAMSQGIINACVDRTQEEWASIHNSLMGDKQCRQAIMKVYREITHDGDGPIAIQRALLAPPDWYAEKESRDHLYWSWTEQGAQTYWGDGKVDDVEWRLYADAPHDAIDWPATIAANVTRPEETEIRLIPGTEIDIEAVRA